MFFRREKEPIFSFSEHLDRLRQAGFQVTNESSSSARVVRNGCGAELRDAGDGKVRIAETGVIVGNELAGLVELGYQKIWQTPGGVRVPAEAFQLQAMHAFAEDLREAVGLISLYNESLGTVNEAHLYDRLVGRDQAPVRRPWERA
jgi:hypothetical protein